MSLRGLFQALAYITLHRDEIAFLDVFRGTTISGPPLMAISNALPRRVIGVFGDAREAHAREASILINPFENPRSLISDDVIAQQMVKYGMKLLSDPLLLRPRPSVVIHPLVVPEGGFTNSDIRAFRDLASVVDPARTIVWQGPRLTCKQLASNAFPAEGRVLLRE